MTDTNPYPCCGEDLCRRGGLCVNQLLAHLPARAAA